MSRYVRLLARAVLGLAVVLPTWIVPADAQEFPEEIYDGLRWTNVGIARGGRSTAVAGSDARPMEYYFGATGGGLWKTTDGGNNWRAVTDGQITSSSVGAVAVCESDPDVVYIGTGETQIRGNIQQGDGAYKSTDAGRTWTHIGLRETQNIARIRIHPDNCDVAWVAGWGVHSADNPERGVFKTSDGGESWDHTLFKSEKAGANDLVVDPNNPDVLYAGIWEAWRKSWGMSSGGMDSGIWKSTDGGDNWTDITANVGLGDAPIGKIGLAVSGANSDRVWAIIEHKEAGGVYRSDDGGESWEYMNDERKLRQRAFYYSRIYADPQDEDVVYAVNTGFYKSEDGGATFPRSISVPHGDNHDVWIAPSDTDRMINANDGGGNVSFNGGQSWTDQQFMTSQFYRVTTTNHEPYYICGAQQDNSTACMPSSGWNHLSAAGGRGGGGHFFAVGGGESGYIASDPDDPDVYYAGSYGGALSRFDYRTGITRAINVWPDNPMGQSSEDITERAQWTFPIVFDNHDSGIVYTATQKVWRSSTDGQSWDAISGDLTRADPMTIGPSGGPITLDQTGVETYATVFAIAPSHHDQNVIWAGSDDGYVSVTRNAQSDAPTWENVTPPDAPDFVRINTIEASPHTPGKAYVSGIRYLVDNDRSPYVWKTEDYGQNWTKITNGIPDDDFVRATREDIVRPGMLYAGTERTVYVSWNDGENWQPLSQNLPVVQVSDLVVEDNDLVIGTHGRSFWVMRDIGILRQMTPEVVTSDWWLFDPKDPVRGFDNATTVQYYLPEAADEITVEIMDSDGDIIFTSTAGGDDDEPVEAAAGGRGGGRGGFSGTIRPSRSAGSKTFRWNQRLPSWTDFEGRIFWAAGPVGPAVVPGQYQVNMTVDGETQSREFEIKMNPRVLAEGVTVADLQARHDLAIMIRDRVTQANEAVLQMRSIKTQIDDRTEENDNAELASLAGTVAERLTSVEGEIYQIQNRSGQDPLNYPIKLNNKIAALLNHVEGAENRPTDQSVEVFDTLSDLLDVEIGQMTLVIQQDLARLNALLRELGMEPIDASKLIA
ncbi:MAG: glycosyl hydrolase [Gemmatimonadales bacterium]|nr:glycosyl hydrolase [Gemmatimonadales bacterium]